MLSGSAQTRRTPAFSILGRRVWADRQGTRNPAANSPTAEATRSKCTRDIIFVPMTETAPGANSSPAPFLTSEMYPRKRLEGKPPAPPESIGLFRRHVLETKDRQHATLGAEVARVAERAE